MGLSLAHARNWRRVAVANLVLAGFLGAGWWVQAERSVVRPFVVEVSDWGQTQKITALDGRYEPTEAQTGYALANWVRDVRGKSIDPIRVNGASLAFAVPPGQSDVRVYYSPWTFWLGVWLAGTAVVGLVGFGVMRFKSPLPAADSSRWGEG